MAVSNSSWFNAMRAYLPVDGVDCNATLSEESREKKPMEEQRLKPVRNVAVRESEPQSNAKKVDPIIRRLQPFIDKLSEESQRIVFQKLPPSTSASYLEKLKQKVEMILKESLEFPYADMGSMASAIAWDHVSLDETYGYLFDQILEKRQDKPTYDSDSNYRRRERSSYLYKQTDCVIKLHNIALLIENAVTRSDKLLQVGEEYKKQKDVSNTLTVLGEAWMATKNISLDSSDITDVRFNRLYNISTEYLKLGELSLALSVANEISKEGWQKSSALEAIVWWYMQRNYLDEALRVARTLGEGYSKCSLIKEIERRFSLQSPLDRNKCIIS